MKITALTENTSCSPDYGCEHGLSLYIETQKHKILFDMGQTELFAENALKLGTDLSEVDIAVLSHGHYDHGGGLKRFLQLNVKAPVYLSRYAFEPHYNGTMKFIGLDVSLKASDRLVYTDEKHEIDEELCLHTCSKCEYVRAVDCAGLYVKRGGSVIPEDFRHEQYLLISEGEKRVLVSGCSHKGILNIVNWFRPDVLVGGFHFMNMPLDDQLKAFADELDGFDTAYYTCHCTGTEQASFMKPYMKKLNYLSAGQTIEI